MSAFEVDVSANFKKESKRLIKKYRSLGPEIAGLIESLPSDPTQGTSPGKACYKIRLSINSKSKGKSGGARVITRVIAVEERGLFLSIYDKSEQADIPDKLLDQLLADANS